MSNIKEKIRDLALRCGFVDCGFTGVGPFEDYEAQLRIRASADIDAADRYLSMRPRARPGTRLKWAKSIVVCLRRYGKYKLPDELVGHIGRNYICDCRKPQSPDYFISDQFEAGLGALGIKYKCGSIPDRAAAVRAGIARIGRNNFAYSRKHGSWVNIETWILDSEIEPDEPSEGSPCPDNCNACIKACPTGALCGPFDMRMSRCISYLTYSSPEPVDEQLWKLMGEWVYGCDVCQQVCPMNRGKWEEAEGLPWIESVKDKLTPEALMNMDVDTYTNVVHPLFWYIKVDNIARWRRNAARAYAEGLRRNEQGQA